MPDSTSAASPADLAAQLAAHRADLVTRGDIDGLPGRLAAYAEAGAERARRATAAEHRRAGLTATVHRRLLDAAHRLRAAGAAADEVPQILLVGSAEGVAGGIVSVGAIALAYEDRWLGVLMAALRRRPALPVLLLDPGMDADLIAELAATAPQGAPGASGNSDARAAAEAIIATFAAMREALNAQGADLEAAEGWTGAMLADPDKLRAAGRARFVADTGAALDLDRSFPGLWRNGDRQAAFAALYDALLGDPTAPPAGLGHWPLLHFRDAGAALGWRARFGLGTVTGAVLVVLRRAARLVAAMEVFGPDAQSGIATLADHLGLPTDRLPRLRAALAVESGLLPRLGGSGVTPPTTLKMPSLPEAAADGVADLLRRANVDARLKHLLMALRTGRDPAEFARLAGIIATVCDGLLAFASPHSGIADAPPGCAGRLAELAFRLDAAWWSEASHDAVGRAVAAGADAGAAAVAVRFITGLLPSALTASADEAIDRSAPGAGPLERHRHIGVLLAGLTLLGALSRAFRAVADGNALPALAAADAVAAAFASSGAAALAADFADAEATRLAGAPAWQGTVLAPADARAGRAAGALVLPAIAALMLTALRDGLVARRVRPPAPATAA